MMLLVAAVWVVIESAAVCLGLARRRVGGAAVGPGGGEGRVRS